MRFARRRPLLTNSGLRRMALTPPRTKPPGVFKRMIKGAAAAAGYEAIEQWRVTFLPIASKVATLLDHYGVTDVLDIGANSGQYRDFLRREVGFAGRIYSFEPDPDLSSSLMRRAQSEDPDWSIFPVALGRTSGARVLNRMASSPFNSFLKPVERLPPAVAKDTAVIDTCPVEVRRLDDFAGELGDLRRTFVKIDTQGFDLEVLAGGRNVIGKVPVLQTEISVRAVYRGMPTFGEALASFQSEGLFVSDLFLVFADEDHRAFEFDCLMVRPKPSPAAE
jgi:FkbM family methyltransferase